MRLEVVKGLIGLLAPVLTAILLYFVARFLTDRYRERTQAAQKQRELQLLAANRFYQLYGEFFAVWKLWNAVKSGTVAAESQQAQGLELYRRSCVAEGEMEAVLVRVATEFRLGPSEVETLAKFRQ